MPVRAVATAQRVLQIIKDAILIARAVEKNNVCIYSFTRTYGEMMPAGEFIRHTEKSIQMIEEKIQQDSSQKRETDIIESEKNLSSLLMTLNF